MRSITARRSLILGLTLLLAGCGGGGTAALYRAEKMLYEARKAETEVRLGSTAPDSTALLKLRARFAKVHDSFPGPYKLEGNAKQREVTIYAIRTIAAAEASVGRLAMEARRADLALATAERLQTEAAVDTMTARNAAFMQLAALQSLQRYDDAVVQMKRIMANHRPLPPAPNGEDPVLALPEEIVNQRRNLGDNEGAAKELRNALAYYQGLLQTPQPPALEAQIRARTLRTYLELNQVGRALEETNTLERLVESTPSLRSMLAEVAFAKGKIKATVDKDPTEGIGILERVATDFPNSPLAPRALFEAATQAEAKGRYEEAKGRYESILQRFPGAPEVAPLSLYRLGIVQDRLGDWPMAKRTLETIPTRYPQSTAAAEAPIAVLQHYARENQKTAAQLYFKKALETYRTLVRQDSSGQMAPTFRLKMYQIYAAGRDSNGIYQVTEEMLRNHPKHPYTAQILLEAARAAKAFGNERRAVVYLRRFVQDFPRSPVLPDVKREIQQHGG